MTNDDSAKLPPVPVGIQRLLRLAADDEAFLGEIEKRPDVAASTVCVNLTANELAILRAIPPEQLRLMVANLPHTDVEAQATPPLPPIAPQGIRPDQPPVAPAGIRPDQPPERSPDTRVSFGIAPDDPRLQPQEVPVSDGIRPDEPGDD